MTFYEQLIQLKSFAKLPSPGGVELRAVSKLLSDPAAAEFFWRALESPNWLPLLAEIDSFSNPPEVVETEGRRVWFPHWPQSTALSRLATEDPEVVVGIIERIPRTENASVLRDFVAAAVAIANDAESVRLLPKVEEFLRVPLRNSSGILGDLIAAWTKSGKVVEAIHVLESVSRFVPDPKEDEKKREIEANPESIFPSIEPVPEFDPWEYHEILQKGVTALARVAPLQTCETLIPALSEYLRLSSRDTSAEKHEDYSEIWLTHLREGLSEYTEPKKSLALATLHACDAVWNASDPPSEELDALLRKQDWPLFERFRWFLYAKYPSAAKEWIRKDVLAAVDTEQVREWNYEFAQMVEAAVTEWGDELFSSGELELIVSSVRSGPNRELFEEAGKQWEIESGEEAWIRHQQRFHLMQLSPFALVLPESEKKYLREIEASREPVQSDDYRRIRSTGFRTGSERSPYSTDILLGLDDVELINTLNTWDEYQSSDGDEWWVEISIGGLAEGFADTIRKDGNRFDSWEPDKWNQIHRPIFLRKYFEVIAGWLHEGKEPNWYHWLKVFSATVVRPFGDFAVEHRPDEQSGENPDWRHARQEIVKIIKIGVKKDGNLPLDATNQVTAILQSLCRDFDPTLDQAEGSSFGDPITKGINSTRGTAVEALVEYAFWYKRLSQDEVRTLEQIPVAQQVLEDCLREERSVGVFAVLGRMLPWIHSLDSAWVKEHQEEIFPSSPLALWQASWGTFVVFHAGSGKLLEDLCPCYERAIESLEMASTVESDQEELEKSQEALGLHLVRYFWLGLIDLNEGSLLRNYCDAATVRVRSRVIKEIGRMLYGDNPLPDNISDRLREFWIFRFEEAKAAVESAPEMLPEYEEEISGFVEWFEAGKLGDEWELGQLGEVYGFVSEVPETHQVIERLADLSSNLLEPVLECFGQIAQKMASVPYEYIRFEPASRILAAGLASEGEPRILAIEARDNLLRAKHFEFMDVEELQQDASEN